MLGYTAIGHKSFHGIEPIDTPLTRHQPIGCMSATLYAAGGVSLGSAEAPYDSDMTHSYRLTEGRLIR